MLGLVWKQPSFSKKMDFLQVPNPLGPMGPKGENLLAGPAPRGDIPARTP